MSVIVLKASGCPDRTAGAQLSSSGDSLSVGYVEFNAHTDATGNVEPPFCVVTLAVSYTAVWSFTMSDLRVDGDIQLSQEASAKITVSSFFDSALTVSSKISFRKSLLDSNKSMAANIIAEQRQFYYQWAAQWWLYWCSQNP